MSLVAINANSPYKVKVAKADDTLCFITDFDAEIFVTFERDDILQNGLVYQFGIIQILVWHLRGKRGICFPATNDH